MSDTDKITGKNNCLWSYSLRDDAASQLDSSPSDRPVTKIPVATPNFIQGSVAMHSDRSIANAVGWGQGSRPRGPSVGAKIWRSSFTGLAFLAFAATASVDAHHNFASDFDPDRMLTVRGTVAEVRYTNPHIRIVIEQIADDGKPIRNARGNPVLWTGTTMSVRVAQRRNFTASSLKIGQVISLRGWLSRKEGLKEMGVSAIIQESGHLFWAREKIGGGRQSPPAPYPGLVPTSPSER